MPAIRDEEWFYSPTFKEGEEALKEGMNYDCLRSF